MKPDPADAIPERLALVDPGTAEGAKVFASALASKYFRVVVKAAKIADNLRAVTLCPAMAEKLRALLDKADGADKGCAAMEALARALVSLDLDDPELYLLGMKYVQKEASWGPPVDTAVSLRATCAMGLANGYYPSKLQPMIELLVDPEWGARVGAARAIGAVGTEAAFLLLRFKARVGDENAEVISQCLESLLAGEGAAALDLATSIATGGSEETREAAVLALGASRRADAVAWLMARVPVTMRERDRQSLLLAISSSRTEAALDYLLELLRTASSAVFAQANEALAIHNRDGQLRERIDEAIAARNKARWIGEAASV